MTTTGRRSGGTRRWRFAVALVAVTGLVGGCGDSAKPAASSPPGSADNPLVARANPGPGEAAGAPGTPAPSAPADAPSAGPGYEKLSDAQSRRRPRSRFTPCNLVTEAQASSILGAPVQQPLEAAQGPTCIYRTRSGAGFVTLAVQSLELAALKPQLRRTERVEVAGRGGYCGVLGRPMLYVPISGGRVLSVAAPCPVARRFAALAVRRLRA